MKIQPINFYKALRTGFGTELNKHHLVVLFLCCLRGNSASLLGGGVADIRASNTSPHSLADIPLFILQKNREPV